MAYRWLQRSLLFCFVVHVLAMLSMATVLAPAMDMSVDVASRAVWVAEHPWLWRIGWVPWQGCALSDLLVSACLVWWTWGKGGRARGFACLALALTVCAVIPEQWAEAWCSVWMPQQSLETYAAREAWLLVMTGTWGGLAYVGMLIFWTLCAASLAQPSKWRGVLLGLTALDAILFIAAGVGVWYVVQTPGYPGFVVVQGLNTVAFPLLLVVNILLAGVLGQSVGRDFLGGVRDMLRPLPFLPLRSDITDVVYLNWWVPSQRVQHLLPAPLSLSERDGLTALSVLHYRHGGFGWSFLGPLRKLLPSPIQSNWRLYCEGGGIYFLHTLISAPAHAVGARLFSDGLPAVCDAGLSHARDGGRIQIGAQLVDLSAVVVEEHGTELHDDTGWLIGVTGAVSVDHAWGVLRHSGIEIPIDLQTVRPAKVTSFSSSALEDIVRGCPCVAFTVPEVSFKALGEKTLSRLPCSTSDNPT